MKAHLLSFGLAFALILSGCSSAPRVPTETRTIRLQIKPVDADIRITESTGQVLVSGPSKNGTFDFTLTGPHRLVYDGAIRINAMADGYADQNIRLRLDDPEPYVIDLGKTLVAMEVERIAAEAAEKQKQESDRVARVKAHTTVAGDFELYWDYQYSEYESAYQRIGGTVKNIGAHIVARLPVRLDVWDENGAAVINSEWTFAVDSLPLRPGETRRWEMMLKKPTPRVSVTLGKPMDRD